MKELIGAVIGFVLGIIGLGMAASYGMRAYHGSGTTLAISEATDIYHSAQQVYSSVAAGNSGYANVNNSNAIRANIVPSTMTNGDGQTITSPWKGATVTLSGSATEFHEDWSGIPSASCAAFAVSQPVLYITINGTGMFFNNTDPKLASDIASACNNGSNSTSHIIFAYSDIGGQ